MNVEGLEQVTIGDLVELYKLDTVSVTDALPVLQEFRDKHGLPDKKVLLAFKIAKIIFDE